MDFRFVGAKITPELITALRNKFKWTIFNVGTARMSITKYGGVHYTGKVSENFKSLSFEVRRGNGYVMVTLMEYPKGVIMHTHIYLPDISKRNWTPIAIGLYLEIKNIMDSLNLLSTTR